MIDTLSTITQTRIFLVYNYDVLIGRRSSLKGSAVFLLRMVREVPHPHQHRIAPPKQLRFSPIKLNVIDPANTVAQYILYCLT